MQTASAVLHRIRFFPCADLWFQMKQLRIYFWNIKTTPGLIQLFLYWPEYDDTSAIFPSKHHAASLNTHKINLLEYKVFSHWAVIETSSKLLGLQAQKYFSILIYFTVFVFLFHSLSCIKLKLTKRFFKEDINKCYS